ncbi:hypothetical protein BO71DRAFT_354376 [Aspergillus ellipticus CBS 707.79]|uniref:C2H2-type domain-containing protein n=1 Tax=Aspergillus ellipticus CBS 707.79 TaxID=1448320 RepID=A0A319D9B0_9EURO|nr:hypothetical protein BO71DRAFT_354376 [Aspergillus ellipticus CBS 707.79]
MESSHKLDDPQAPARLLHYLPDYQVVVCTACKYAVQPHGILRHLKEIHRILRGHRRKYHRYISGLSLRDPKDATPPERADQFPVPYLPVEPGLRCQSAGCPYLCASVKRMQAHWRLEHGQKGDPTSDWGPAPLQTFFRGNLLHYFTHEAVCSSQTFYNSLQFHKMNAAISSIQAGLNTMDTALLEYYFQHTYKTFTRDEETDRIWRLVIPSMTHQNRFLLHGMLACTSLHRAYMSTGDPTRKKTYLLRAYHHQDIALPQFRYAIEQPNRDNCDAILAFAYLLVVYSFGTDQPDSAESDLDIGSLLFVTGNAGERHTEPDSILPNWLHILRGGCSMLCDVWGQLQEGPLRALTRAWEINLGEGRDLSCLDRLMSVIPQGSVATGDSRTVWSEDITAIYRQAAIQLSQSFAFMRDHQGTLTTWDILRIWPMEVSLEYMALLHQGHPGALILLAYFCVLLRQLERHWHFEGRAALLIRAIQGHLSPEWLSFIDEPLEMVLSDTSFWE